MKGQADVDDVVAGGQQSGPCQEIIGNQGDGSREGVGVLAGEIKGDGGDIHAGVGNERSSFEDLGAEGCVTASQIQKAERAVQSVKPCGEGLPCGTMTKVIMVDDPAVEAPTIEKIPDSLRVVLRRDGDCVRIQIHDA